MTKLDKNSIAIQLRRETIKALRRKGYRMTTIKTFSWEDRYCMLLAENEENLIWRARAEFRRLCIERKNLTLDTAAQQYEPIFKDVNIPDQE